jgi:hypothetical protein
VIPWVVEHLEHKGKNVNVIVGVDTSEAIRWLPLKGVWFLTEATPCWFLVGRLEKEGAHV